MIIPAGKHAGKELSTLADASILAMANAWKNHPLLAEIHQEILRRGLDGKKRGHVEKSGEKRTRQVVLPMAAKLRGIVDAKCYLCGHLSRISANSWETEDVSQKPRCHCGGMIYLADPSLVVVEQTTVEARIKVW